MLELPPPGAASVVIPFSRRKDTSFPKQQMKRMMHKKEYLLQTRNLQQIFYQTNEICLFSKIF
jgi:hypothetical protein